MAILTGLARTDGGLAGVWDRLAAILSGIPAAETAAPAPLGPIGPQLGGAWLDGLVPYHNAAREHEWAVRQAVAAWNGSGAHVRFVPTERRAAAVVIESASSQPCGHGRATVGFSPNTRVLVFEPRAGDGCDRFSAARVLAHELGHVLGLRHIATSCATMNPVGGYRGSAECKLSEPWRWRCRLLEHVDILAAVELYGGAPKPVRRRANCSLYRRVEPPRSPRLLHERSTSTHLAISFARPADAAVPRFLRRGGVASFAMAYSRGACTTRPETTRYRWSVGPGEEEIVVHPILGSGVHCLRVWAVDELGRFSKSPATLKVDVNL